jgi:hypothetical protein
MRLRVSGTGVYFLLFTLTLFAGAAPAAAQTRTPKAYAGTLTMPRITRDDNGHVVATMETQGDLRGMITFELDPDGDSGAMTGKWALVVAYVQDTNADGTPAIDVDHHEEHHEEAGIPPAHREYARFVREGTVFGDITTATLRIGAGGAIEGIDFAQLLVAHGSMKFALATGSGSITTSPLDPALTSLSLTF